MEDENKSNIPKIKIQRKYLENVEDKNYINNKLPLAKVKTSPSSFLQSIAELEKKEEEEKKAKQLEKVQFLRNKEREIVLKRKKRIDDLTKINTPKYISKKDYITADEKEQKRLMEEEALLQKEIKKRKMRLQPISSHELDKFSREVQRNEKMFKEELGMKKIQMKQLWQERKNLLPEYKSKFFEYNVENEDELEKNMKKKKDEMLLNEKRKIEFGEDVLKNFQPKYNDILKNKREENIKKMNGVNKFKDIKELDNKLKKISSKITQSQPKNFKLTNKFVIDEADGGKRKVKKLVPLDKPIDYLTEERIIKMRNSTNPTSHKWENMLKSDNNVYNNIEKVKMQAELLQNKADTKKQLLKHEKGTGNINLVDDLNNEITNLYIGSIQAKLEILKKIGKKD